MHDSFALKKKERQEKMKRNRRKKKNQYVRVFCYINENIDKKYQTLTKRLGSNGNPNNYRGLLHTWKLSVGNTEWGMRDYKRVILQWQ